MEACASLGVSWSFWKEHNLAAEFRWVRIGDVDLLPLTEIQSWLERNATRLLEAMR
jgi:hypothetical protein